MVMSDLDDLAHQLAQGVGMLRRRLRQLPVEGSVSEPEMAALVRLDRGGPASNSELARLEQISPQSMNATLAALEGRGLVGRSADPADRRRVVLALTDAGQEAVLQRRAARRRQLADALTHLDADEVAALRTAAPVLARLAEVL
jgi:DNA-binding MarR family transcriptional regulator